MKVLNWKLVAATAGAAIAAAIVLPMAIAKGPPASAGVPYGTAQVLVNGTPWAQYTAPLLLESPASNSVSGTFRFTCHVASCALSIKAASTEDGVTMYPRVLIYQQPMGGGPETYCEYGDATTNDNTSTPPLPTTPTLVTLGIGGSLDCPGHTQTYPANGVASSIDVPAGYYDVQTTFFFTKS